MKKNKLTQITSDQNMITGTQTHLAQLSSFPVGSQTVALADIVKVYQDRITTAQAAQTAQAAATAAVQANRDKRAQTSAFTAAFRRMVQGMFAESPDTLASFGLAPIKVGKRTVATKANAIAKNKATRVARHTMGSNQKKDVKGTVDPSPTTSPSTPVAPPAAPVPAITAAPAPTPVIAAAPKPTTGGAAPAAG